MGIGHIGIEDRLTPVGGGIVIIIEDRGNAFDTIHILDEVVPLRFNKGHQIRELRPPMRRFSCLARREDALRKKKKPIYRLLEVKIPEKARFGKRKHHLDGLTSRISKREDALHKKKRPICRLLEAKNAGQ